jgi:hypothetical protein
MGGTEMTEPMNVPPPAQQTPMPAPVKPQGLAVASLVLGIVGCTLVLNLCFVPSILAIVFGSMARRRVREGTGGGEGLARAGRICGIVSLALSLALTLLWVLSVFLFATWRVAPSAGPM